MKPFKHLKQGMSFIEVVAALAILAIFGSSLFLMQTYLFDRILVSQRKLFAQLRMQTELIAYQTEILKELFAQEGPIEKSLQKTSEAFEHPDMTVMIKTRSDFKDTSLQDYKNLYLISTVANNMDKEYGTSYFFVFIPKVEKK